MWRRRSEEDFRREVEAHLDLEVDRLVSEGRDAAEARRLALLKFGNVTVARERFLERSRFLWAEQWVSDLRYAVRGVRQSPAFAAIAVATLAIGIGASTAVATQVNAIFFEPVPVADRATLRSLSWTSLRRAFTNRLFAGDAWDTRLRRGETIDTFPHAVFRAIQEHSTGFSDVACWRLASEALTETGHVRVHAVSGTFFRTIGVPAAIGRSLSEADDHAAAPLVALARDPALLNQPIRIHGHAFIVVGILPEDFAGLNPTAPADIVVPYAADHLFPTFQRNDWGQCHVVARVKPGVSWEQARAETEVIVAQAIQANPPTEPYDPPSVRVQDLSMQFEDLQRSVATPLWLLGGTVGLLLLITCANIGGLLFARGRARHKELATRLALGGARTRVVRQLLTESLVLCAAGGAAGVGLAYILNPLLPRLLNQLGGTTLGVTVRPDFGVLLFAFGVTVACGVLFGLLPALAATRVDPALTLKQSAGIAPPARLRAGKAALALQLALTVVVIVAAGLLVRTLTNLRAVPLGYTPEGMVFVETNNPVGRPRAVVEDTLRELEALPGVSVATVSQWPIFNNTTLRAQFCVPGASPADQRLDLSYVFPKFFDTWGVRLIRGHDIPDRGEPVAIVNETFAKRFFAGRDPVGQFFASGPCPGRTPLRIVGLVQDHIDRQRVELVPAVYLRYPLAGALYVTTYALRTEGDERALLPALRRVVAARGIAPNQDARTGTDYRDSITRREQTMTTLLVFFGGVSLFISALGVYGMLAYTVSWRTPEIGLRIAIGAARPQVIWMIVRESLIPVTIGTVAGLVSATWLTRWLEGLLFGVAPHDPVTAVGSVMTLLAAAGSAAGLAAIRACRVDPVTALRCE